MASHQEKGGFCPNCNEKRMVRRRDTNHILHFIISLCTFGAWIIMWILFSIKIGGWKCAQCGSKAK